MRKRKSNIKRELEGERESGKKGRVRESEQDPLQKSWEQEHIVLCRCYLVAGVLSHLISYQWPSHLQLFVGWWCWSSPFPGEQLLSVLDSGFSPPTSSTCIFSSPRNACLCSQLVVLVSFTVLFCWRLNGKRDSFLDKSLNTNYIYKKKPIYLSFEEVTRWSWWHLHKNVSTQYCNHWLCFSIALLGKTEIWHPAVKFSTSLTHTHSFRLHIIT